MIRAADASDAQMLATLHSETVSVAYQHIFGTETDPPSAEALMPAWKQLLNDTTNEVFLVQSNVSADAVVGSVAIVPDVAVPAGLLLKRLHVHPDSWGHGIGSDLHDHGLAVARRRGAQRLNLWVLEANERARTMYERRGWKLQPGWHQPNQPTSIIDVLYERDLT